MVGHAGSTSGWRIGLGRNLGIGVGNLEIICYYVERWNFGSVWIERWLRLGDVIGGVALSGARTRTLSMKWGNVVGQRRQLDSFGDGVARGVARTLVVDVVVGNINRRWWTLSNDRSPRGADSDRYRSIRFVVLCGSYLSAI